MPPRNTIPRCVLLLLLLLAVLPGCMAKTPIAYDLKHVAPVTDPQFIRTISNLLGPPLIGGNSVQSLSNGDQIFPAMLEAIAAAKKSITFETYVYWSGDIGKRFADALTQRAAAGVSVHVILDWIGSDKIDRAYIQQMRDAGATVVQYHPLHWYDIGSAARLINRTHRKLLVVDGTVGFIGGVGIADVWKGNAQSPDHWRDMHYRVTGPVVAQLQGAFLDNWIKTTGQVLDGPDYFPPLPSTGEHYAQVFKSGVEGGSASMELMFLLSLYAARQTIRMGNPYFVPSDRTVQGLLDAANRGVRVQLIVPGPIIDSQIVRKASRDRWGELLQAGVQIYEYQPTMYHTKLLVVDDRWVSVGSANIDNLSFALNDEANLNVLDADFAAQQSRIFDEDRKQCREITYEQWSQKPLWQKLTDSLARLFQPLL